MSRRRTAPGAGRPTSHAQRRTPPRWLRVGPALIVAIALSVVVWVRERPDLQPPGGPPIMERAPLAARRALATPDVSELLHHADALALTPQQRNAIEQMVKQWGPESAERRRDMNAATDAFNEAMRESQRRGKVGLDEIYRGASESSALTTEWLARKADYWQRGLAELTAAQRQRVKQLIPARLPCRDLSAARTARAGVPRGERS